MQNINDSKEFIVKEILLIYCAMIFIITFKNQHIIIFLEMFSDFFIESNSVGNLIYYFFFF